MPTYLVHGFRWHRAAIRIHVILQDLDDAAPEWLMAPATSNALLNNFYSSYDFLPPSNPPPGTYEIPASTKIVLEEPPKRNVLRKNNSKSMTSLKSFGRKKTNDAPPVPELPNTNGTIHKYRTSLGKNKANGTAVPETSKPTTNTNGKTADRIISPSTTAKTSTSTAHSPPSSRTTTPSAPSTKRVTFNDWSAVKLVEQYDPDSEVVSQPYAYVADYIVPVPLSVSIPEEIAKYKAKVLENESFLCKTQWPISPATPGSSNTSSISTINASAGGSCSGSGEPSAREVRKRTKTLGWLDKLRDKLQKDEEIGWYVVYCGDEERWAPPLEMEECQLQFTGSEGEGAAGRSGESGGSCEESGEGRMSMGGRIRGLFRFGKGGNGNVNGTGADG